jgi:hypothetical protein
MCDSRSGGIIALLFASYFAAAKSSSSNSKPPKCGDAETAGQSSECGIGERRGMGSGQRGLGATGVFGALVQKYAWG